MTVTSADRSDFLKSPTSTNTEGTSARIASRAPSIGFPLIDKYSSIRARCFAGR